MVPSAAPGHPLTIRLTRKRGVTLSILRRRLEQAGPSLALEPELPDAGSLHLILGRS